MFDGTLESFAWALPYSFRHVSEPDGTSITLSVSGERSINWVMSLNRLNNTYVTAPYLYKTCLAAGDQNTVLIVARDDTLVNRVVIAAAGDLHSGGVAPVALAARIGAEVTVADDVVGSPCYDIYTRPRGIG